MTEMTTVRLGGALGAEVKGIDASRPLGERERAFVRDALDEHGVVVLRGQHLTPAQQRAFSQALGTMRVSFMTDVSVPGTPELTVVSNIVENGKAIGLVDAGALWHTDGSYLPRPDMYTVLYALQIPKRDGKALGDTLFLSTTAAYDALPADKRATLDAAQAVHSLTHHIRKKEENNFKAPPVKDAKPDVVHPAVRVHPHSGKRCIYVTEGHTKEFVGFDGRSSDALLADVAEHVKQPQFVYRHHWQVGDLLIWDNCSTQHLAITDYGQIPRRLHRAGIEGPVTA
jgi:taurine dioxygenase